MYDRINSVNGDVDTIYSNTNELFTEQRSTANKSFVLKKGTPSALKYATKSAFDAKLQGDFVTGDFFFDVKSYRPFTYQVDSNIMPELFEAFIKPLAHPIGMIPSYRMICTSDDLGNIVDLPLVEQTFSADVVSVNCLCFSNQEPDNLGPDPEEITCGTTGTYPAPKIFATTDGTGLWEGIQEDEGTGNILVDFKVGTEDGTTAPDLIGLSYQKYIFQNNNLLMSWFKDSVGNEAPKVTVRYLRYDPIVTLDWSTVAEFINTRHCNIFSDKQSIKKSSIKEDFRIACGTTRDGIFEFRKNDGTDETGTGLADTDGIYRGYRDVTTNSGLLGSATVTRYAIYDWDADNIPDKAIFGGDYAIEQIL
jgi:hypothetical protein